MSLPTWNLPAWLQDHPWNELGCQYSKGKRNKRNRRFRQFRPRHIDYVGGGHAGGHPTDDIILADENGTVITWNGVIGLPPKYQESLGLLKLLFLHEWWVLKQWWYRDERPLETFLRTGSKLRVVYMIRISTNKGRGKRQGRVYRFVRR